MDAKAEKIALFRYGLIAPLVLEALPRGELTRRAQEIAARHYEIPGSQRTSVSVDTLLEWALRYRNGGFEALAPQPRQDRGQSRTITPQLADLIERLKRENPHRTGGGKMQAYLHATLEDASRLIPHAQFYASQGLDACPDCLRQAIAAARGLPVRLYKDNAKIYRGQQLARIAASIGILVVHTPPYQPEGRGKIERFFRSVREQFLANLDRKQTLSLDAVNDACGLGSTTPITAWSTLPGRHAAGALATRYRAHPATAAGHRSAPALLSPSESTSISSG